MNGKNKKMTKALTAIVAILLCLVLISTSIVSGTLAKFVVTKNATTEVALERFGVKMRVKNADSVVSNFDKTSAIITYNATEIYPGFENKNMVLFTFDGTLTVPARLTVRVNIDLEEEFYISSDNFESISTDINATPRANAYNMPVDLTAGMVESKDSEAISYLSYSTSWTAATYVNDLKTLLSTNLMNNFRSYANMKYDYVRNNGVITDQWIYKDFESGYTFKAPDSSDSSYVPPFGRGTTTAPYGCGFGFGIRWSMVGMEKESMVETWIADKIAEKQAADSNYVPMTITITVSLEQTGT